MAKNNSKKWPWWMILLWAYSILYILFWMLVVGAMMFFPSTTDTSSPTDPVATIVLGVLFIPVFVFLVLDGIENLS